MKIRQTNQKGYCFLNHREVSAFHCSLECDPCISETSLAKYGQIVEARAQTYPQSILGEVVTLNLFKQYVLNQEQNNSTEYWTCGYLTVCVTCRKAEKNTCTVAEFHSVQLSVEAEKRQHMQIRLTKPQKIEFLV